MSAPADIARTLAWIIREPDEEVVEALNSGEICGMLSSYFYDVAVTVVFLRDGGYTVQALSLQYAQSFLSGRAGLSLAESVYKPWCGDSGVPSPDYTRTGLLMGDPAVHMMELFRRAEITVPDGFCGEPDHISLELEFLAGLLDTGLDNMALFFIRDHLDWVPELVIRCAESLIDPFYLNVIRLIDAFVAKETRRLSVPREVNA